MMVTTSYDCDNDDSGDNNIGGDAWCLTIMPEIVLVVMLGTMMMVVTKNIIIKCDVYFKTKTKFIIFFLDFEDKCKRVSKII